MVRHTQRLHPPRTPAAPLLAATVLLLRDSPHGIEVLMTRRSSKASFAPDAYVFPGGGIDANDALAHERCATRATQSAAQTTEALAAIRESFEELGLLLARRSDGQWCSQAQVNALERSGDFYAQCAAHDFVLAADAVFNLAHWTADRALPKRFAVPFLVAAMPAGQQPVADEAEQFEPVWVRPVDALARHKAGDFFMIFPTIRTLEHLLAYATAGAVLAACAATEQPLWTSCPRAGLLAGREARYMEHELPFGELALVCPDGQIVHPLDWQSDHPVALLKNVMRLSAPNPGVMTGPGTNSYLVGDPRTGYIAIDPGPLDAEHIERLWRAAGGDIRLIVCTHSHPDHAPGAQPLQALCANAAHGKPPILGLPSGPEARAASAFTPDRALQNNELLTLTTHGLEGDFAHQSTHTLQVIHTPGHAANHLCLVLLEDGLLFSGDHILNGSTTVIDPPDGDMNAYLASLDVLTQACAVHDIGFILPAHGYVLTDAPKAIDRLRQHRLGREAKILQAMRAQPEGTLDDWLALAYADVPTRMWPVAKRSLLAHVQRLDSLG